MHPSPHEAIAASAALPEVRFEPPQWPFALVAGCGGCALAALLLWLNRPPGGCSPGRRRTVAALWMLAAVGILVLALAAPRSGS